MEQQQDFLNEMDEKKLPGTLSVLTILTFIGSGLGIIMNASLPWLMNFSAKMMDKALENKDSLTPDQLAKIMEGKRNIDLVKENLPITITVGIIGCIVCIVAAIMMRKRKKDGYLVYLFGEIAPVITGFIVMKSQYTQGISAILMGLLIPAVFVILYTTQRKHLTN